ncbi:threonine aspartase 1 isoform X2 [Anabrus simplex]|uniref:threonine aspartase 1 isoform X2 n=1 Tax=Anabrus simplex TaxID=316456 RepID=UPI0034DD872E
MSGFVGLHLGAGQHSESLLPQYKKLAKDACKTAQGILRSGGSAVTACTEATAILENSPLTNAGFGSNLTWDGRVECDASVMDGENLVHGAIGAVPGVKNPVFLARHLCLKQNARLALGRVPPSFLVGEGARLEAVQAGIPTIPPEEMISPRADKLHHKCRKEVHKFNQKKNSKFDTVGAVCIDSYGRVAAACSSGGITLKVRGRVGQAGVYGCGCWAERSTDSLPAVATCTSGCGEYLIRTTMAQGAAMAARNNVNAEQGVHQYMMKDFLGSPFLENVDKLGGVIVLKCHPAEETGEFLWAHTTKSMLVASMSTLDDRTRVRLSVLDSPNHVGKSLVVQGIPFKFKRQLALPRVLVASAELEVNTGSSTSRSSSPIAGDGSNT